LSKQWVTVCGGTSEEGRNADEKGLYCRRRHRRRQLFGRKKAARRIQ